MKNCFNKQLENLDCQGLIHKMAFSGCQSCPYMNCVWLPLCLSLGGTSVYVAISWLDIHVHVKIFFLQLLLMEKGTRGQLTFVPYVSTTAFIYQT